MFCKHNWMTVSLWEVGYHKRIGSLCSACTLLALELFHGASVAKAPHCLTHLVSTMQPISLRHRFSLVQLYQHSITKLKQIKNISEISVFRGWNSSINTLMFCTEGHFAGLFFFLVGSFWGLVRLVSFLGLFSFVFPSLTFSRLRFPRKKVAKSVTETLTSKSQTNKTKLCSESTNNYNNYSHFIVKLGVTSVWVRA